MSKDSMDLTAGDLLILHGQACKSGTLDKWALLALDAIKAFSDEIERLKRELNALKCDTANVADGVEAEIKYDSVKPELFKEGGAFLVLIHALAKQYQIDDTTMMLKMSQEFVSELHKTLDPNLSRRQAYQTISDHLRDGFI